MEKMIKSKARRRLYMLGYYWEQVAIKVLRKKLGNFFYLKTPPNYPVDFIIPKFDKIYLVEVKYSNKNKVLISKKKLARIKSWIWQFKGHDFYLLVLVFFGSKYAYKLNIYPLNSLKQKQIVIQKN